VTGAALLIGALVGEAMNLRDARHRRSRPLAALAAELARLRHAHLPRRQRGSVWQRLRARVG
jgi:hypothetical protein